MATRGLTKQITKPRVALYTRVSTDDQATSIENQSQMFTQRIEREGWEFYRNYCDEGISGTKVKGRACFIEMLDDAKQGKFDILLVKSYSRFARNQRESLQIIANLIELDIRVIFAEDNLDSGSKSGMANFGIFSWLAEEESRRTSTRIKEIWNYFDSIGRIHAPIAPYGYDFCSAAHNFVPNDSEAMQVRHIFEMYADGKGARAIVHHLTDNNIPTKRKGKWSISHVLQILHNPVYTGTLVQGKSRSIDVTLAKRKQLPQEDWHIHPNNHEPIVGQELWSTVQQCLQVRSDKAKAEGSRHSSTALFSNLIWCGECGKAFTVKRAKRSRNYSVYYSCSNYEQHGATRAGHKRLAVYEEDLCQFISGYLNHLIQNNLEPIRAFFEGHRQAQIPKAPRLTLKAVEEAIEEQSQMAMTLFEAYAKKLMPESIYVMQCESLDGKLQKLMQEKTELVKQLNSHKPTVTKEEIITKAIAKLSTLNATNWSNEMLKQLINRITINHSKEIHIYFKFTETCIQFNQQSKGINVHFGNLFNTANLLHSYKLLLHID